MQPYIVRQGDIMLIAVSQIPAAAAKKRARKRVVVAEGEVTGHHHVLVADRVVEHTLTDAQVERRFLEITEGELVHDEHDTITLPAGRYEIRYQREYTPEAIRRVAD